MKSKNLIKTIVSLMALTAMTGCGTKQLSSPIIANVDNLISWNSVEGATEYRVFVDESLADSTTLTFYTITVESGTHNIYVVAANESQTSPKSNSITYTAKGEDDTQMIKEQELKPFSLKYDNLFNDSIEHVSKYQLKRKFWWDALEGIFYNHRDNDGGYSAEFWGKLLRGGVLTYQYDHDEELYTLMENTVTNILNFQDTEPGHRLSGFDVAHEFGGWDLRSRGYNLIGLYYFQQIAKTEALKNRVIQSMKDQADYIMKYIGPASEGKTEILDTSPDWGGTTSANLLDGMAALYSITKEERFGKFCEYIIGTGGSKMLSSRGTTILEDCANGVPMYQWGCRKFYENTLVVSGVLKMYLMTNKAYYRQIIDGFFNAVYEVETTEVGGVAVDVEEACHSTCEQCNPDNLGRMQETCAVTNWLKFCLDYYQITQRADVMDAIEKTFMNHIYGTIDVEVHNDWPIFSYSPCGTMARADIYSGTAWITDDYLCQSCCVISGVSSLPLIAKEIITKNAQGISANLYLNGKVTTSTPKDQELTINTETNYPVSGNIKMTLGLQNNEQFTVRVRIPAFSAKTTIKVNGETVRGAKAGEYFAINREWKNNDTIEIEFEMATHLVFGSDECSNANGKYNVCVERGPITFARDSRIEGENIFKALSFASTTDGILESEVVADPSFECQLQLKVKLLDGSFVTLVDYGSAGKTMDDNSIMCLWIPTSDYYSSDISKDLVLINNGKLTPMVQSEAGHFISASNYKDVTDPKLLSNFAFKAIKDEATGKYRFKILSTGGYLTIRDDYRMISSATLDDAHQLFQIKRCGLNKYKLVNNDLVLSCHDDGTIYMYDDISHTNEYWIIRTIG